MGKVLSSLMRPAATFNIESRAHKVISKPKPTPAPKYQATIAEIERLKKDNPNIMNEILSKNEQLDKRLKDVFVTSQGNDPEIITTSNKALPLNRGQVEDFEYGVYEPDIVPPGKVTLKNALKFIGEHQAQPEVHTAEQIAQEYNLNLNTTNNILKFYHMFQIYIPKNKKIKTVFGTSSGTLEKNDVKELDDGQESKESDNTKSNMKS